MIHYRSTKILLQYSNYCIFQNVKQNKIKHEKKRTTFSAGLHFHMEERCYNTLKGRLFFIGLKISIVKHENAMQISVSKTDSDRHADMT